MIVDLKDQPHHITTLAEWHHQEWSHLNPGSTLQTRIDKMRSSYLSGMPVPRMFVWVEEDQAIGSAAIVECDMDSRPELTPWLASVFVKPDSREMGIGAALVEKIMAYAGELGFDELFLFTPDREQFYENIGWQSLATETYHDRPVTVMKVALVD